MSISTFRTNGKLLLTAEYFVLDGALAAAVPTRLGQTFTVTKTAHEDNILVWTSLDSDGSAWFSARFDTVDLSILQSKFSEIAQQLRVILLAARKQNSSFLMSEKPEKIQVLTELEFPRLWGLGSSSTLIAALGDWAKVNPYRLLAETMGGSGYDIACAVSDTAIFFQKNRSENLVTNCDFNPIFRSQLYFIYLEKKQNSREGIAQYKKNGMPSASLIGEVSELTRRFIAAQSLSDFEKIIVAHEKIVAAAVGLPRAKSLYFSDFWGEIKSLGAWGGDFILATSDRSEIETRSYFNEKGFKVFLKYDNLV